MKSLIYDPNSSCQLALREVAEPVAQAGQALIAVQSIGINFADIAFLPQRFSPGDIVGFEAAGVVLQTTPGQTTESELKEGARVVGFAPQGGWAQKRAIDQSDLTLVPEELDLGVAVAIPAVGVTALRALRELGSVVGRRVLITGASGGVGRMAIQLAHRAGAYVIAGVGSLERGEGLRELGADEVVVDLGEVAPVFGVLENVGGALLSSAYERLEAGGLLQSIGAASLEPSTLDFEAARLRGGGRIQAFNVFAGGSIVADVAPLLQWAAGKELDASIGWRGSWTRYEEAITALRERKVRGKVVLDVD